MSEELSTVIAVIAGSCIVGVILIVSVSSYISRCRFEESMRNNDDEWGDFPAV